MFLSTYYHKKYDRTQMPINVTINKQDTEGRETFKIKLAGCLHLQGAHKK